MAGYDYPGVFVAGGQTKSETTAQFISSAISEIKRLQNDFITEDELDYAKNSILNSFVFKFQTPSQTLSRLMTYEYYDYPQDFIFKYQDAVKKTQVEDVKTVAQQELKPENLVTLVVGNGNVVKPNLQVLNQEINTIDIES